MQSKQISEYVHFGTVLRYLQDTERGTPFHGDEFIGYNIEHFFHYLAEFNLLVTLRASVQLENFYEKLKKKDKKHELTVREASQLRDIMDDIRLTLDAETLGRLAFIATDKRINVDKLFYSVETLMAPGVFVTLPEVAKHDFEECGKCIVFERPTAAAFHMLRGTESVLRMFYLALVKRKRLSTLMWGPVIDALKKRRNSPPDELLNNLDNIRKSFRNPTQHPEKIYDIQEAQDLFSLCVDVINRMIRYLNENNLLKENATTSVIANI
jgi:hypothetical protein